MTDILDLPGWMVLSKSQSGGECVIEAEYTVQPKNCPKCGVVDTPYKHGTKPISYRDSPIRGESVSIQAHVQRYKCRHCQAKVRDYEAALKELACLGNGDRPGNSIGNAIAQAVLAKHGGAA